MVDTIKTNLLIDDVTQATYKVNGTSFNLINEWMPVINLLKTVDLYNSLSETYKMSSLTFGDRYYYG